MQWSVALSVLVQLIPSVAHAQGTAAEWLAGTFVDFGSLQSPNSPSNHDNLTYTRPWTADFTPYLMLGMNASYPVSDRLTISGLLLNGYWHLAHANGVPSIGTQLAYKATDHVTVKQTVLYGPHQANTALGFWRFLSNTIVERKTDRLTAGVDFHVSEERIDAQGGPRACWWPGNFPCVGSSKAPGASPRALSSPSTPRADGRRSIRR